LGIVYDVPRAKDIVIEFSVPSAPKPEEDKQKQKQATPAATSSTKP